MEYRFLGIPANSCPQLGCSTYLHPTQEGRTSNQSWRQVLVVFRKARPYLWFFPQPDTGQLADAVPAPAVNTALPEAVAKGNARVPGCFGNGLFNILPCRKLTRSAFHEPRESTGVWRIDPLGKPPTSSLPRSLLRTRITTKVGNKETLPGG